MCKLTDEKLINELMDDYGWSRQETINGYGVFYFGESIKIERIDDLFYDERHNYRIYNDIDAYIQAFKDGVIDETTYLKRMHRR